jgi:hypothetical protein
MKKEQYIKSLGEALRNRAYFEIREGKSKEKIHAALLNIIDCFHGDHS